MRNLSSFPERSTEPFTTFPVTSYERPGLSSDGLLASVEALKLVYTSAVASATAAPSVTISRSLRLREGSIGPGFWQANGLRPAAGVPLARPGGQQQHEPGVRGGTHLVALVRLEVDEEAGAAADGAAALLDLHRTRGDDQPRPLVHLVLL